MRISLLLVYFFRVCLCEVWCDDDDMVELTNKSSEVMNGTLRNVVKKYYCSAEDVPDERTILYGTKAWSFPQQDVNLTLRYPTANPEHNPEGEFLITGVLVLLYVDGPDSKGYITRGGVFKEQISITFIIKNITRLSYQFWLYGVSKPYTNFSEFTWQRSLC